MHNFHPHAAKKVLFHQLVELTNVCMKKQQTKHLSWRASTFGMQVGECRTCTSCCTATTTAYTYKTYITPHPICSVLVKAVPVYWYVTILLPDASPLAIFGGVQEMTVMSQQSFPQWCFYLLFYAVTFILREHVASCLDTLNRCYLKKLHCSKKLLANRKRKFPDTTLSQTNGLCWE